VRDATLLNHVGQVQATHVDRPARGRVMEGVCGLRESLPVAEQRGVSAMAWNKIVSRNHKGQTSRSDVLLRTSVDDAILGPVDVLGEEVAGHVTDECLAGGHLVVRELGELETLNGFVVAVVEELGTFDDIPVSGIGDRRIPVVRVVSDLVGSTVLLGFLDCAL
jgi:hypothetical protein